MFDRYTIQQKAAGRARTSIKLTNNGVAPQRQELQLGTAVGNPGHLVKAGNLVVGKNQRGEIGNVGGQILGIDSGHHVAPQQQRRQPIEPGEVLHPRQTIVGKVHGVEGVAGDGQMLDGGNAQTPENDLALPQGIRPLLR